jgi:solute carrier family 35 protein F1/2
VEENDDAAGSNEVINTPSEKYFSFFGLKCTNRPRTYAIIAIVDVYAAFFTITAFKYTTITSVILFDALAIHSAMFVSRFFFNRRYVKGHILGVLICTIGIMLNVAVDYEEDKESKGFFVGQDNADQQIIAEKYPHKIAGDILAISGGILYGIANTLQEVAVKETTVVEYLGCSCFFASIVTFSQAMLTEREEIMAFFGQSTDTCAAGEGENLLFLYAIAGILKYIGVGYFLQISDATFFNLSLMTGDAWAVAFSVFAEGIKPPPTFYIALVLTMSGVIIYETAPSPVVNTNKEIEEDTQAIDRDLTEGVELQVRDEEDHLIT